MAGLAPGKRPPATDNATFAGRQLPGRVWSPTPPIPTTCSLLVPATLHRSRPSPAPTEPRLQQRSSARRYCQLSAAVISRQPLAGPLTDGRCAPTHRHPVSFTIAPHLSPSAPASAADLPSCHGRRPYFHHYRVRVLWETAAHGPEPRPSGAVLRLNSPGRTHTNRRGWCGGPCVRCGTVAGRAAVPDADGRLLPVRWPTLRQLERRALCGSARNAPLRAVAAGREPGGRAGRARRGQPCCDRCDSFALAAVRFAAGAVGPTLVPVPPAALPAAVPPSRTRYSALVAARRASVSRPARRGAGRLLAVDGGSASRWSRTPRLVSCAGAAA